MLGHVIAQDVGRALNPALVEGQMRGGATQGLGWALLEELAYDEHGQLVDRPFVDYALPTAAFTPLIDTEIVEVPGARGAVRRQGRRRGARVGVPGAVANAVAAATAGVRHEAAADDARAGLAGDCQWRRWRSVPGGIGPEVASWGCRLSARGRCAPAAPWRRLGKRRWRRGGMGLDRGPAT